MSTGKTTTQSGTVTPNRVAVWATDGTLVDAGPASGGAATTLGVTNNGGFGLCVNSGPVASPFTQYAVTVSSTGTVQIIVNRLGDATPVSLEYVINGTIYPFIGSSG